MKGLIISIAVLVSSVAGSPEEAVPGKIEVKEAEKLWGKEINFEALEIPGELLSDTGTFRAYDRVFLAKSLSENLGYVVMTKAMGRFEYFDYALYYSNDLLIENVVVSKYRSSRGAAICSKGWLKQFKEYDGKSLAVGDDVQAISGATISANSITNDIQRSHRLMRILMERK